MAPSNSDDHQKPSLHHHHIISSLQKLNFNTSSSSSSPSSSPKHNQEPIEAFTDTENCNERLRGDTSRGSTCNSRVVFNNKMLNGDQITSCGYLTGSKNYVHCSYRKPMNEFVVMAKTHGGSVRLQKMVEWGSFKERRDILEGVLESVFEVMTNAYGYHLFLKLVEFCDSYELEAILVALTSNRHSLIRASLNINGSIAVQGFIKKLKGTGLGRCMTSVLSISFVELMTSVYGRFVVEQCFYTFEPEENEVLYNKAVRHFKEVATSERGCLSLKVCLSCISGVQRHQLLENIADESLFLANDPLGNYVVQQVLMLKNDELTRRICDRLKRQYLNLSLQKNGSHVVEKCILASEYGMMTVVSSLLSDKRALLRIACDQFGNYVVKRALVGTKTDNRKLYKCLVNELWACSLTLSSSRNGSRIICLIKNLEMKRES